jgi:hypothetical protein
MLKMVMMKRKTAKRLVSKRLARKMKRKTPQMRKTPAGFQHLSISSLVL